MKYQNNRLTVAAGALALGMSSTGTPLSAQHSAEHSGHAGMAPAAATAPRTGGTTHDMWMRPLGRGWSVMGTAQLFPIITGGTARSDRALLTTAGVYATQPAIMANISSPGSRVVLRTTLNFEELTQENGELSFGGWGEGYLDARHPHTLLHEAMLSANWWHVGGGTLSLSAGKGFAPYGTDDPMGRPALKFPTNHHLSQVLERFTANAAYLRNGWGIEAGVFGGAEPDGAYDFSNIDSFGDSWSARLSKRFRGDGPTAEWEMSSSFARVAEAHHGAKEYTNLLNGAVRHAKEYGVGRVYALVEASRSRPQTGKGHYALLGEAQIVSGRARTQQAYVRTELSTRPEYERNGAPGSPGFFRYRHGAHEVGATRWFINTVGYGVETRALPVSVRPFVEVQHHRASGARGTVSPSAMYGGTQFFSITAGARLYFGGGAMRMGSYGMLDPMTSAMRQGVRGSNEQHVH